MNWPWGQPAQPPTAPWGNYAQMTPPTPQVVFNQFGQQQQQVPPHAQGGWPFNNDNNPAPWRNGSKYPSLHPILAADSTQLTYNVTHKPSSPSGVNSTAYMANAHTPATRVPTAHIRLISPQFPWSIDIQSTSPITVGMVWDAVYAVFQDDVKDSEWGCVVAQGNGKVRAAIEKAAKKRIDKDGEKGGSKKMTLRRIDWLGEQVCLKGLEYDEGFVKARLLPGEKECPDTWVVRMYAP